MRVLIGILMAGALAASAQAQLRLPIAPLPALPVQKLTQTLGQVGVFYTLLGQQDFGAVEWRHPDGD